MADVLSAVRSYLLAKTAVTDLISQRMYFDQLPQNVTLPACTLFKISETHPHLISDRVGHVQTRIQITCHATRRLTANSIAEAIYKSGIVALKGISGGVNIRGVQLEDGQRNYPIHANDGSDDHQYVTEFDLMVSYRE